MIHLASQSPRRHELLNQIGVPHTRVAVTVDETPFPAEPPEDFVKRMALTKARAGLALHPDGLVLGSDTAVVLDEQILGKPDDREHALEMLRALSGREHRVLTGVALVSTRRENYRLSDNRVRFRALSDGELTAYWATGEPIDKAGAYAVQGLGALFIQRLEGSYSGVMGLPLFETGELLSAAGLPALKPVTLMP